MEGDRRPDVSVLVVSYGTRELTRRCLRSVLERPCRHSIEVVVVDNASDDGSAEMVATEFPSVRLVVNEMNVGFARAVNQAAASARGAVLVLLNPDAAPHRNAVDALVDFTIAHPEAGLCGGLTVDDAGRIDPRCCAAVPSVWSTVCFALGLSTVMKGRRVFDPASIPGWDRTTEREVGVVTGCFLAVTRDVWDRLGGFDPQFFLYGEDVDLAIRARALGYRPRFTPGAVVTHEWGASTGGGSAKGELVLRARVTLLRKHWSPAAARVGVAALLLGSALRAGSAAVGTRLTSGAARGAPWREIWRRRRSWSRGYSGEAYDGRTTNWTDTASNAR